MNGISCDTTMKDVTLRLLDYLKEHGEDSVNHTRSSLQVNKNKLGITYKELENYLLKKESKNSHRYKINPDKMEILNGFWLGPDYDEIINVLNLYLEDPQKQKITLKNLEVIDDFIICLLEHQKVSSHALSSPLTDTVMKKFAQKEYDKYSKIFSLVFSLLQKIDSNLALMYSFFLVTRLVRNQGSIDEKWNEFKKIFTDQSSY